MNYISLKKSQILSQTLIIKWPYIKVKSTYHKSLQLSLIPETHRKADRENGHHNGVP